METECESCKKNTVRENWKSGKWDKEPNVKRFEHAGLACIIHRGPGGHWCGYVGVEENHPYYGKDDGDIDDRPEVHGGVTYADWDSPGCVASDDGKKRWWFGFDCAHCEDRCPAFEIVGIIPGSIYRTMDYAISETKSLAEQIAKKGA